MTLSKANYDLLADAAHRDDGDAALVETLETFVAARGAMSKAVNEVLTQMMLAGQPLDLAVRLLEAAADLELAALDMGFTSGKLDLDMVAQAIPGQR